MKATIYHNPRCSKSRQTVELLKEYHIEPVVIDYQKTPLDKASLDQICEGLNIEPKMLVRAKEKLFKELGLSLNDNKTRAEWLEILHQYPKLIERPVVEIEGRYAIGRPPETIIPLISRSARIDNSSNA